MSNLQGLQEAIRDLAMGAAASGTAIDVDAAATALSTAWPQSGMTIDEICKAIVRAAAASGAGIYFAEGDAKTG